MEPYICIFEDCPTPDACFRERAEWLFHMQASHVSTEWACPRCPDSRKSAFSSADGLQGHILKQHGDGFDMDQIPTVVGFSAFCGPTFTFCPLCHYGPKERDRDFLPQHIETHLQLLSLLALPAIGGDDSEKSVSHQVIMDKESISFASRSGAVFDSELLVLDPEYLDPEYLDPEYFSYGEESNIPRPDLYIVSTSPDDTSQAWKEWDFIPLPDYSDQSQDELLAPFVKKFYYEQAIRMRGQRDSSEHTESLYPL